MKKSVTDPAISGGFIILSRNLLKSGIMGKPPLYSKLWVWMLLQASHKEHGRLKRGQFFTSLKRMQNSMTYKVGYRKEQPTLKKIRGVCDFLTKGKAIVTTKVTHGMIITILNYDYYQCPENYERHNEGHDGGNGKGTILTRRDNKNGNNTNFSSEIEKLKSKYPHPEIIDKAIIAISSTRKGGKVASSVILKLLHQCERYTVEQVETGIQVYLAKECASQGKDEKYLMGIIRNQKTVSVEPLTTGSVTLDAYYAEKIA